MRSPRISPYTGPRPTMPPPCPHPLYLNLKKGKSATPATTFPCPRYYASAAQPCRTHSAEFLDAGSANLGMMLLHVDSSIATYQAYDPKTFISQKPKVFTPRRSHVGYVGYRRNPHQHVGYTSFTRPLRRLRLDILAAWVFGK